jgi:hypothetical protein
LLDDLPLNQVHAFEEALLEYFGGPKRELRQTLEEKKSFKGMEDQFVAAMKEFKATWKPAVAEPAPAAKAKPAVEAAPAKKAKPAAEVAKH